MGYCEKKVSTLLKNDARLNQLSAKLQKIDKTRKILDDQIHAIRKEREKRAIELTMKEFSQSGLEEGKVYKMTPKFAGAISTIRIQSICPFYGWDNNCTVNVTCAILGKDGIPKRTIKLDNISLYTFDEIKPKGKEGK